jgi:hypothetical protein
MSADPTNGQSNIDVILKAMAPERREAFLRSRNRLKQFNENDEILALAHYLDTVVVMVDGLTKNVAAAMSAHTEPMANLTAQLKRVAAELPSHANRGELKKRNFMHAKRQSSSETTNVIQARIGHLTVKVFFAL